MPSSQQQTQRRNHSYFLSTWKRNILSWEPNMHLAIIPAAAPVSGGLRMTSESQINLTPARKAFAISRTNTITESTKKAKQLQQPSAEPQRETK